MKNEIDFFISHSSETKQKIAIPITQILTNIGFDVWLDRKQISVGQHIYPQIVDAIKLSAYCIAIIDDTFLQKTWPLKELQYFHKKSDNNILPIFVNIENDVVYDKISWLDGIAFEKISSDTFNLTIHMDILCRIVSRYYENTTYNLLENYVGLLSKYSFPCKETLLSLLRVKEYYSQDFRLAIISLCNVNDITYAIFKNVNTKSNKSIEIVYNFSNIIKHHCFNIEFNLNYTIYTAIYNSVLVSISELKYILEQQ